MAKDRTYNRQSVEQTQPPISSSIPKASTGRTTDSRWSRPSQLQPQGIHRTYNRQSVEQTQPPISSSSPKATSRFSTIRPVGD
ncbi:hypothetical protein ACOMHN_031141 [Nucella lapillus]